jgi:hypothetical protein
LNVKQGKVKKEKYNEGNPLHDHNHKKDTIHKKKRRQTKARIGQQIPISQMKFKYQKELMSL